jgi:glutamate synthase (NADPH/NADH) small chain
MNMARRQEPPKLSPGERVKNFKEVVGTYLPHQAIAEAARCLFCHDAPCNKNCPAGIDVAGFIRRIRGKDFRSAIRIIKENNFLPGICARVCPVEELCEKACSSTELTEPINISALQRFVSDLKTEKEVKPPEKASPTGKKVAVIGSGPAGIAAAAELSKRGHEVTIFEAKEVLGGTLVYGIPPYRLPKDVAGWEIKRISDLGVKIKVNKPIRKIKGLFDEGFDAIFIGTGMMKSISLNIPGEDLKGVYLGFELLERVSKAALGEGELPSLSGKRVAVIGGGDVAIDAARCGLRLGAKDVILVYRRTQEEMPAHVSEVNAAKEEGVKFRFLSAPIKILGDEGRVIGLECIRMELGPKDETGRRRPIPIPGSEFRLDVDVVIEAIGQAIDEKFIQDNPDIKISGGRIVVDEKSMTSSPGVFAGGDVVNGGATVVQAIAEGKKAAEGINNYLNSLNRG